MKKQFRLNNQVYEVAAITQDTSRQKLGKIVVYHVPGAMNYFSCPLKELVLELDETGSKAAVLAKRVALYRKRFVGRTDAYAQRYFNKKQQKDVYAPVVEFANNRPLLDHWIALTDEALVKHLEGKIFLGFYPMYPDNTTKYLVIDIDKQNWMDIVQSMQKVCHKYHIPILTERSQSGNGGHLWLFFTQPIAAVKARHLGDAILKATMAINPNLSFTAFDRLFPSQDLIGEGKLGNLIAGPLQGARRKSNNSVFIDAAFKPLSDQWAALESVKTLDELTVDQYLDSFASQVTFRLFDDDRTAELNLLNETIVTDQLVSVIRKDALYISEAEMTAHQIAQLKWLASFKNPKFYEKQQKRLSLYNTPRIISLFEEYREQQTLILPRGLESQLTSAMPKMKLIDQTNRGQLIHASFKGQLYPDQKSAYRAILAKESGVLSARTGFGKTVIAAKVIAQRGVSTLILVNNKELASQWVTRLTQFLTITDKPLIVNRTPTGRLRKQAVIGQFFGNKHNRSGIIDVATIQSFKDNEKSGKILNDYGMVIFDEVHHEPAFTYDQIIRRISAKYLLGLSATPIRRDGQEPIIAMRFGEVLYETPVIDEKYALTVKRVVIPRFTSLGMSTLEMAANTINQNYEAIANDHERDQSLYRDVQANLAEKRHILILTHRVQHVEQLAEMLRETVTDVFVLYGAQGAKDNTATIELINRTKTAYVIVATAKYAGEGLDIGSIDTVMLAMPNSWHGSIEQYLGRMQRKLGVKNELRVYDFVDVFIPMLARMYRKRLQAYKKLSYMIQEDERSRQTGLKFFEGNYQKSIVKDILATRQVIICCNRLSSFLVKDVLLKLPKAALVTVISNKLDPAQQEQLRAFDNVTQILYDHNLPNCIVMNEQVLWISSDIGFRQNRGVALRAENKTLVRQFVHLINRVGN
ncbi:DEAD/DEAH box helicase [Loigolactobacillus binensis]|uniref:DEAD/DEAH box helicase family protein n=1 Tax=Loigolactobacillus binensis TaxID=2559922 RepID=A0ABW3EBU3_9LACO|nr:DEAD/DEAH box helicase [Loigolactobacillus binensis]